MDVVSLLHLIELRRQGQGLFLAVGKEKCAD